MTDILPDLLTDDVVLWEKTGEDDYNQPTFDTPKQIKGKLVRKTLSQVDREGAIFVSTLTVYTNVELKTGSVIWEGLLASAPTNPPMSQQIKSIDENKDTESDETLYVGYA